MIRILVAEDERDIRDLIAFTLRFANFDVELATNGSEAVEKALQVKPDLILMDVRMPKMTGYEACRELKTKAELEKVPVVFLSAKGQESEISKGMSVGGTDYILKPFAPDDLIKQVKRILAEHGNLA
ncbi:MAG: response regulator [Chloroflexota bacterium]|nr:response regulator [Chloroflexota bacterium]